jgi:hypothetical protein
MPTLSQRVKDFSTVTVLRNPRDRLISAFDYWRRMAMHNEPNLPAIMRRFPSMTFAEFLTLPETFHCADNVQARLLAGGQYGTTNDERIMVYGDLSPIDKDRFAYIGRTEDLDAAARAICQIFAFEPPVSEDGRLVGHINASHHSAPTLTPAEESLIRCRTGHDWLAYESL